MLFPAGGWATPKIGGPGSIARDPLRACIFFSVLHAWASSVVGQFPENLPQCFGRRFAQQLDSALSITLRLGKMKKSQTSTSSAAANLMSVFTEGLPLPRRISDRCPFEKSVSR